MTHARAPFHKGQLSGPEASGGSLRATSPRGDSASTTAVSQTIAATGDSTTATVSDAPALAGGSPASPSEAAEIAFISGITASGTVAATSFRTWNSNTPATYSSTSDAFKWGSDVAGTSGGTVYYYFDASSDWTTAEETVFREALALWSAEANVTFTETTDSADASVTFTRGSDESAYTDVSTTTTSAGSSALATPAATGNVVSIDTSVYGWDISGGITSDYGYAMETVVHELGHVLGLGHAGAYNGSVNAATQQYSAYDSRLWSIMSYIDPGVTTAKYYSQYTYDADWTNSTGTYYCTTPMMLDIAAIQELYGAATTGDLTEVQTFGFDSSFASTDLLSVYFDFTLDTNPIVTIWDSASGCTLDLSGYASASTIDLIPGTFSSCDGMTDNIGIATGTWIDKAVGGSGNDLFITNTEADTITGGGGTDTVEFASAEASYTLARSGTTVWVSDTATGVTDTLTGISELEFSDQTIATASIVACFAEGTHLATPEGAIPVERLRVGNRVRTLEGVEEIVWLGHRRIRLARHPRPWDVAPVHIRPGAFAPGAPAADLWLSPDHSVFVDGCLVPVRHLLNGATIVQESRPAITYWHVELARHEVLLAEGLACESYLDTGNRACFVEAGGPIALHPDFAPRGTALEIWKTHACAPLLRSGALLQAIRKRLLTRAETLGHTSTPDSALELVVDGVPLTPQIHGETLHLALPDGAATLELRSRAFRPAETSATRNDTRRLGVALAALALDDTPLPLSSPRLAAGWHAPESDWRWSNGSGHIDVRGTSRISLRLASAGAIYWEHEERKSSFS